VQRVAIDLEFKFSIHERLANAGRYATFPVPDVIPDARSAGLQNGAPAVKA